MAKELIWSRDSLAVNKTLDDSLDLLFCQDFKRTNVLRERLTGKTSVRDLIKLIREIW